MKSKVSSLLLCALLTLSIPLAIQAQSNTQIITTDSITQKYAKQFPQFWQTAAIGQSISLTDNEEEFNNGNLYDPWQLIQGRLPGVSITRPGGDPNGEFVIRIRGLNTLGSDWRPLVVIDGVAGMSIENVDPNDIATIQVLKDASAAAFYGVRAANGVVLITTKRAEEGAPSVTAYASVSIDNQGRRHQTFSAAEFLAQGGVNNGADINYIDELTHTGLTENLGFSIRQTVGGTSYSASVNYRDVEGLVGPSKRRRLNSAFVVSQKAINDRLTLSVRVNTTTETRGDVDDNLFRYMTLNNPTSPIFDDEDTEEDGGYFQEDLFGVTNPVALLKERFYQQERRRLVMSGQFAFEVTPFLSFTGQYTQDRSAVLLGEYLGRFDGQFGTSRQGYAQRRTDDSFVELADIGVEFNKALNSNVRLYSSLGMGFVERDFQGFVATTSRYLFDSNTFNNLGAGANRNLGNTIDSYRTSDRINSYYGRVAVSYKQSLNAYFNWRADSYSGFINNKTGHFYGMGLRYDLTSVMDAGKFSNISLRMGYGVTGNLPRDPNLGRASYGEGPLIDLDLDPTTQDDLFFNLIQRWDVNPELRWETVKEFTMGLDFTTGAFGLSGSIDYFSRDSQDLIFQVPVVVGAPNVFAPNEFFTAGSVYTNFFDLSSSGVEVTLNYQRKIGKEIEWQSQANAIFYQQPTIERMSSPIGPGFERLSGFGFISFTNGTNFVNQLHLGGEVGALHTPRYLGKQEDGSPLVDGDPFSDNEKVGSSLPSADIGFYNRFVKGNWELNFLLRGSMGHSLLNVTRMIHENNSLLTVYNNGITSDKDQNLNQSVISDLYVEDGSFLRLNHLTLSRNIALSSGSTLNLSITGQNLFNITGYEGIDPEVRHLDGNARVEAFEAFASGIATRELYFPSRTWTLGARVTF